MYTVLYIIIYIIKETFHAIKPRFLILENKEYHFKELPKSFDLTGHYNGYFCYRATF